MADAPSFEPRENGPLVVKGLTRLIGEDGAELEAKPVMALCRCGHSQNKPFCDGSHQKAGFDSHAGTPAGRDRVLSYEGEDVIVTFNPMLCSHAAECNRIASNVFDAERRPWIQPDKGTVAEIEAVVAACPSGALRMSAIFGPPEHRIPERTEVVVQPDGPYWVCNVATTAPAQGEGMSKSKYVLCRCGKSGNKPYCDGTHRDIGWKSS